MELRGELEELKLRVNGLESRIAAAELKQRNDLDQVNQQMTALGRELAALRGKVGDLESLLRANHYAQIHLWGVTARLLKLPDAEIDSAQQHARAIFDGATRG